MIVIGVDTHKRSHTLVALDATTGATRGQLTIPASDEGTLDALRFAGELDVERVWAVEDCRHVSGRLERGLVASGGSGDPGGARADRDLEAGGARAREV
jgi:transposase